MGPRDQVQRPDLRETTETQEVTVATEGTARDEGRTAMQRKDAAEDSVRDDGPRAAEEAGSEQIATDERAGPKVEPIAKDEEAKGVETVVEDEAGGELVDRGFDTATADAVKQGEKAAVEKGGNRGRRRVRASNKRSRTRIHEFLDPWCLIVPTRSFLDP